MSFGSNGEEVLNEIDTQFSSNNTSKGRGSREI
jgi:hypothetical protein